MKQAKAIAVEKPNLQRLLVAPGLLVVLAVIKLTLDLFALLNR
jgi:hypothetical protein